MFEDYQQQPEAGVTIITFRFPAEEGRVPVYVRTYMNDARTDDALKVIQPEIDARKALASMELDKFLKEHPARKVNRIFVKLFPPTEEQMKERKDIERKAGRLRNIKENPLFDFDLEEGEACVRRIINGLKSSGFTEKSHTVQANGTHREEKWLFI